MQRGRDALVNAPTGSGKTLAYLAPIVGDLQAQTPHISRAEGAHALVLVPTRELCLQVSDLLTLLVRRYIWLVKRADSDAEPAMDAWLVAVASRTVPCSLTCRRRGDFKSLRFVVMHERQ